MAPLKIPHIHNAKAKDKSGLVLSCIDFNDIKIPLSKLVKCQLILRELQNLQKLTGAYVGMNLARVITGDGLENHVAQFVGPCIFK